LKNKNRILVVLFLISACTTSKSTAYNSVNLAKYEYASVINNDTYDIPAELMEYEILNAFVAKYQFLN